ncbi:MAG: hypothetical protein ACYTGZ_08605 [Planctomycetota bacterium]|jgi:hypothetical protein
MPGDSEPKSDLKFAHGFAIGCGAALTLYAVFVIRHFNECSAFIDGKSGGSVALMGFALAVVVAASGFVTAWSNSTGPKNAFFTGLGIPGFLLAADVGSGGPPPPTTPTKGSFGFYALLAETSADGSPGAAALILSPFSTVTAVRRERVEKRVEEQVATSRRDAEAKIKQWSADVEKALKAASGDLFGIATARTKPALQSLTDLATRCEKWGSTTDDPAAKKYVGEEIPRELREINNTLTDPFSLTEVTPALAKVANGVKLALRTLRQTPDVGNAIQIDLGPR